MARKEIGPEEDSEEERFKMEEEEAQLYSMIHYTSDLQLPSSPCQEEGEETPAINTSIFDEMLKPKMLVAASDHQGDSGRCSASPVGAEVDKKDLDKQVGARNGEKFSLCSAQIDDVIELEDSTYYSSDTDDGILIVGQKVTEDLQVPPVITLESDSSGSELEIVPTTSSSGSLQLRTKASKNSSNYFRSDVSVVSESRIQSRKRKKSESSSSSSSSDSDQEYSAPQDIRLNVTSASATSPNPTFAEVTSMDRTLDDGGESSSKFPGWNEEMHRFYNEVSMDNADLTLDKVLEGASHDPNMWKVGRRDSSSIGGGARKRPRYFSQRRCNNCNRIGHVASDCPEPESPIVCYMCGEAGHRSNKCPGAKCLQCGEFDIYYSNNGCRKCRRFSTMDCFTCGGRGHPKLLCPNNWRKFHATVSGTRPVRPDDRQTQPDVSTASCSNCGRKGHFVHQCQAYSLSPYRPSIPYVVSYRHPMTEPSSPSELVSVASGNPTPRRPDAGRVKSSKIWRQKTKAMQKARTAKKKEVRRSQLLAIGKSSKESGNRKRLFTIGSKKSVKMVNPFHRMKGDATRRRR